MEISGSFISYLKRSLVATLSRESLMTSPVLPDLSGTNSWTVTVNSFGSMMFLLIFRMSWSVTNPMVSGRLPLTSNSSMQRHSPTWLKVMLVNSDLLGLFKLTLSARVSILVMKGCFGRFLIVSSTSSWKASPRIESNL